MNDRKPKSYFELARTNIIGLIPPNSENRILEVGAGCGNTLMLAKTMGLAKEVVGVDKVSITGSNQFHPEMDRFIVGDIEDQHIDLQKDYFDVIICADVLEHLVNPWAAVNKLRGYLKEEGSIIASVPNFREKSNVARIILKGDFRYSESGVLDENHLRFFCKRNITELFELNGLAVTRVISDFDNVRHGKRFVFNKITLNLFYDFFVTQYLVTAKKIKSL